MTTKILSFTSAYSIAVKHRHVASLALSPPHIGMGLTYFLRISQQCFMESGFIAACDGYSSNNFSSFFFLFFLSSDFGVDIENVLCKIRKNKVMQPSTNNTTYIPSFQHYTSFSPLPLRPSNFHLDYTPMSQ